MKTDYKCRLKNEDYIEMEDVDYDNRSALHLAACENRMDVVKYILSHHFCFPAATDRLVTHLNLLAGRHKKMF